MVCLLPKTHWFKVWNEFWAIMIAEILQIPNLNCWISDLLNDIVHVFPHWTIISIHMTLNLSHYFLSFRAGKTERVFYFNQKSIHSAIKLLFLLFRFIEALLLGQVSNIYQDAPFVIKDYFVSLEANDPVVLIIHALSFRDIAVVYNITIIKWVYSPISPIVFVLLTKKCIRVAQIHGRLET